jgi:hypothetical protein
MFGKGKGRLVLVEFSHCTLRRINHTDLFVVYAKVYESGNEQRENRDQI